MVFWAMNSIYFSSFIDFHPLASVFAKDLGTEHLAGGVAKGQKQDITLWMSGSSVFAFTLYLNEFAYCIPLSKIAGINYGW